MELSLKVTRGETVDRQTVLHIEVDDQQVDDHLQRAYQRVAQKANIPGFRKGKAPRSVVERFVGREYLMEEALESLVPEAVSGAIEQENITAAATPRVSIVEREPVVKLDATVALPPVVTLGDYSAIRFDDASPPVTDEQIEESLQRVMDSQATFEPVERAAEAGDLVTITVKGTVDGELFTDATDAEFLAEADNPAPVPGFSEKLVGMQPGESREFTLPVPEDFSREEFAGKQAEFQVSLSGVKAKVLPPLDDELAKSLGEGFETLEDVRKRIRENLETSAADELRRSLEDKVLDALVEGATFEVSPMIVEHEAEHVIRDQQQQLAMYNISLDAYMKGVGKSSEEIVSDARQSAERRLKRTMVLDQLADTEDIQPTDEDVTEEIDKMKAAQAGSEQNFDTEDAREAVRRILRRRAAVDRVIEIAQQKDGAAITPTEGTSAKAGAGS